METSEKLAELVRDNTHKLEILSSLEEEKEKLISLSARVAKVNVIVIRLYGHTNCL